MTAMPRLALVPGEPAGIGPEIAALALARPQPAQLTVIADRTVFARAIEAARADLAFDGDDALAGDGVRHAFLHRPGAVPPAFGTPDPRNARSVVDALLEAARGCDDGRFDGMVTGPVHKAAINDGGIAFTGTTELLAGHAAADVVMMLAGPTMRVALATTHLPLRAVPDAVTAPLLERVLRVVDAALRRDFAIPAPRIAVLGLNPHAGEDGHLGREELDVIAPLLGRLRAAGLQLDGPLPADTAFLPAKLAATDAVVAMYHDQGLPVLKAAGFEQAVNITLGLPWPRVAVDHGTALDLAGRGSADPSSLVAAIATCAAMARGRARA